VTPSVGLFRTSGGTSVCMSKRCAHSCVVLGLKSKTQWVNSCTSGEKPADIPSNTNLPYWGKGWAGYGDRLGTAR
jgi:hypothetical protein